jgi:hypothetical protein
MFGGYFSWKLTSTPGSKINKKVPKLKIKNVQLLPSIQITIRGRIIHLHHWMNLSVLLVISIFIGGSILDSWVTRGFLVGGIVQGLRFSDRGSIFKKNH